MWTCLDSCSFLILTSLRVSLLGVFCGLNFFLFVVRTVNFASLRFHPFVFFFFFVLVFFISLFVCGEKVTRKSVFFSDLLLNMIYIYIIFFF